MRGIPLLLCAGRRQNRDTLSEARSRRELRGRDRVGQRAADLPIYDLPSFFLLLLSPLYFPQIREVMYARRLYRTGVLAQGNVVFVKKRSAGNWPGWPGSSTADVYVAHQLPGGGRVETVVRCTNDWLVNQFSPGATVHILLSPDQSKRGVLLETFIR